jgi:hypothetical protein
MIAIGACDAAVAGEEGEAYVEALLGDLQGQVSEAVSRGGWFQRWGKHYLRFLSSAHAHQICNNFKDPGVQSYGNDHFRELRERLDELYCDLPPPIATSTPATTKHPTSFSFYPAATKKSAAGCTTPAWKPVSRVARLPVDMHRYHNPRGGCVHPCSQVTLASGARVVVEALLPKM